MAAAKVQSIHDFVLYPHQDRAMASMSNNTAYSTAEFPGMPAYTSYPEDESEYIYHSGPMMSTAAYTESTYSTSGASAQSAASSAVGSAYSEPCHNMPGSQDRWMDVGLGIAGGLAHPEMFPAASYPISENTYEDSNSGTYVDPSLVHYGQPGSIPMTESPYSSYLPPLPSFPSHFPGSPSLSELSSHESHRSILKSRHQSPRLFHPYPTQREQRRESYTSRRSGYPPVGSPRQSIHSEEEGRDSRRCPHPDCGRLVKDIKAHMLTHQAERPEKCPIVDCEYHIKGFARKYDRCRHTLTHFKGTMVCNFCPGTGSSLEKSFNRADVFKRHLTSVHSVEQSPPNSRKKSPSARKALSSEDKVAAGCSTCSATFRNAQEFYDHLDDCVLKYLDKGEASETHNERHLKKINNDKAVKETMERNSLPLKITNGQTTQHYDDEEENDDDEDTEWSGSHSSRADSSKPSTDVQRWQSGAGLTRSTGGIKLAGKAGRRGKKNYPASWGSPADKMPMKKRVLVVYDGDRRLWKDEMMLENEHEVRIGLPENRYYTDFDDATVLRANALHNTTDAEKGPYTSGTKVGKLMI